MDPIEDWMLDGSYCAEWVEWSSRAFCVGSQASSSCASYQIPSLKCREMLGYGGWPYAPSLNW